MAKILLSGYYGFDNAGDEAILCSLIDGLRQTIPKTEIVVLSGNVEETKALYGVKAIGRLNYPKLLLELSKADLLISGGGSLLQDATGSLTIPYYLSIIKMAKLMNVPVMFFSQGVGPVSRKSLISMIARTLNGVESITVRDHQSAKLLTDIGLDTERVIVTADPVFFLQPTSEQRVKEILISERIPFNENGPWIGVSLRPWANQKHYIKQVAIALDALIKQFSAHIILLPFQYNRDYEVLLQVCNQMQEMQHVYLLQNKYRVDELLGICQQLDIMLGMRLHSLIFAVRNGVIPLGISYDPKIDALLARLKENAIGNTNTLRADKIIKKVEYLIENLGESKEYIKNRAIQLEKEAWQAIRIATKLALEDTDDKRC